MALQIVKKSWKVWCPTVWDSIYGINYDYVYAQTVSEAKKKCTDYDEFINIKAVRNLGGDIVLFEGKEIVRGALEGMLKERERTEKRRLFVEKFPDTETFYIQNGYVGNSVLWWALNSNGYTCDIYKAQEYTKASVLKSFVNGREEDIIWLASHVKQHIKAHVDGQYLKREYCAY